jgi:hypothetical protein
MFCQHLNESFERERERERESKISAEKSVFLSKFQLATLGRRSEAISITSPILPDLRKKLKI